MEMAHHCGVGTGYCSEGLCAPFEGLGSLASKMPSCGLKGMQAALLCLGSSRAKSWYSWAEKWAWTPKLGVRWEYGQP